MQYLIENMVKDIIPQGKLAAFWVLGAICFTYATWILGRTEGFSSLLIAFLLYCFAGLCWIGVGVGVAHRARR